MSRWALWLSLSLSIATSVAAAQPPMDEARRHFEAGVGAYERGDYEVALEEFRTAHRMTGSPDILYNIAQCADRLRRDDVALESYRAYLAQRPRASDRAQVEARIEVIERALAEEAARVEAQVQEREDRRREQAELQAQLERERAAAEEARRLRGEPPPDPGVAPWILFGGGLAVAVTGAILVGVAELDAACVGDPTGCVSDPAAPRWQEVEAAYDRVVGFRVGGGIGIGVGVAAAIAGLTWAIVSADARASFEVALGPGSFTLRGAF
ncbi:MAG: tol-pal system YbgF family protein [Sandaracinaceae bacterium]